MTTTTTTPTARAHDGVVPDGDHDKRPLRRRFSAEYKLAILAEYEGLTDPGSKGALLRREGLYSSHIVEWRRAKEVGAISGLTPKRRTKRSGVEHELDKARRKIERLEDQVERHRKALEAQGKASELLARLLAESADPETRQQP